MLGLIIGVVGLILAVAKPHLVEAFDPPVPAGKLSDTLAEAGDKFVGRMLDRARGRRPQPIAEAPTTPATVPLRWYLAVAATSLGLAGALSGLVGRVRRGDHRLAPGSIVAGSLAVAWTYIVAALVIALAIVFLILLLGALSG